MATVAVQVERRRKVTPRASVLLALWDSTIGKKVAMAITGVILVGFVIGHMIGNLKIYEGETLYNAYAEGLRTVGAPFLGHGQALWIVRVVLIVAVVVHMVAAAQLARRSLAARPKRYALWKPRASNYASRTMRWGGVIIILFVIYHLLHFTAGVVGYAPGQFVPMSVYRNVVIGFSVWYVSAFYILAQLALGLHLFHGVWSMFQTVGVTSAPANRFLRGVAVVVAAVVVVGNISIPVAVLTGVVR